MRFSLASPYEAAVLLAVLLTPLHVSAGIRCDLIRVDDVNFDLSKLGGPHSVVTSQWHPPTYTNTSYTLDICKPLKRKGNVEKGDECPNGTQVCAIQRRVKPNDDHTDILEVIPIAGELKDHGGGSLDAKFERLKSSDSNTDSGKEGLRIILNGGKYPLNEKTKRMQKAVIEFICDKEKTGLEGETVPEDLYEATKRKLRAREDAKEGDDKKEGDKKDDEKKDDGKEGDGKEGDGDGNTDDGTERQITKPDSALLWNSYGKADKDDVDVLRLTWHTKYACEDAYKNPDNDGDKGGDADKPKEDVSSGWGFFTWFILIAFLAIAAYLIFGSWLNYNRYGARGWDLLPHGDTIRDIPYILKDLARSLLNTVQGSGTRGGYSAL